MLDAPFSPTLIANTAETPQTAQGGATVGSVSTKPTRKSNLKDVGYSKRRNPLVEQEFKGDIEGKSHFKCSYGRKHFDDEYEESEEGPPGEFEFSPKPKKKKIGCKTCDAQIKDK